MYLWSNRSPSISTGLSISSHNCYHIFILQFRNLKFKDWSEATQLSFLLYFSFFLSKSLPLTSSLSSLPIIFLFSVFSSISNSHWEQILIQYGTWMQMVKELDFHSCSQEVCSLVIERRLAKDMKQLNANFISTSHFSAPWTLHLPLSLPLLKKIKLVGSYRKAGIQLQFEG